MKRGLFLGSGDMIVLLKEHMGFISVDDELGEKADPLGGFYRDLRRLRGGHGGAMKEEYESIFIPISNFE